MIHKETILIRTIISTIGSITYSLAKWLSKHIVPVLNKIAGTRLKNANNFVSKIRNMDVNNKIMEIFDVNSLFTYVPVKKCINFLGRKLAEVGLDLPVPVDVFVELLNFCVNGCYFSFNGDFYNH